eukprot:Hpha_TRINITY_DN15581_c0_g2::TRINITY_DN15581_c0_g2_i1::g.104209::m.104209
MFYAVLTKVIVGGGGMGWGGQNGEGETGGGGEVSHPATSSCARSRAVRSLPSTGGSFATPLRNSPLACVFGRRLPSSPPSTSAAPTCRTNWGVHARFWCVPCLAKRSSNKRASACCFIFCRPCHDAFRACSAASTSANPLMRLRPTGRACNVRGAILDSISATPFTAATCSPERERGRASGSGSAARAAIGESAASTGAGAVCMVRGTASAFTTFLCAAGVEERTCGVTVERRLEAWYWSISTFCLRLSAYCRFPSFIPSFSPARRPAAAMRVSCTRALLAASSVAALAALRWAIESDNWRDCRNESSFAVADLRVLARRAAPVRQPRSAVARRANISC